MIALVVCLGASAQQRANRAPIPKNKALRAYNVTDRDVIGAKPSNSTVVSKGIMEDPIIMTTKYDNQTNASNQNRIYRYDDGTIGAVMTASAQDASYSDRGSWYNYFDGTAWGPQPTQRIETQRTGWPSLCPLGANGEIVVAHVSATRGLIINTRSTKGTGAWTETELMGPSGASGMLWPRLVSNGPDHNNLHMICLTAPTANGGTVYEGLDGALLYNRSLDGGVNWEGWQMLPEMTSSEYLGFPGDGYAWAEPRGDTLAFTYGDSWMDQVVMKSTDNGVTWQKIIVWPSPYNKWEGGDTTGSFYCPDGNMALALDKHGKAHLTTGLENANGDDTGGKFWTINQDGLLYWNENMDTWPSVLDIDWLDENGYIIGWCPDTNVVNYPIADFAYWYCSMSSMPTIVADDFDNIFVVWSSITDLRDPNNYMLRHLIARASTNGGQSWHETLLDVTSDFIQYNWNETVFVNAAPFRTGDSLYLLFQSDVEAGSFVKLAGAGQGQMSVTTNDIIVMNVSKQAIINPGTGVNEHPGNSIYVSQNTPNPFHGRTTINVQLENNANLSLAVYSIVGKKIYEISKGNVDSGSYQFSLDGSQLQSGVYFYTVKINNETVTKKMIVE